MSDVLPMDLTPLRATPGALPHDGARDVAGIAVPEGRALPVPGRPGQMFWAAPQHLEDPWPTIRKLQIAFPQTGLWPLLTYARDSARYPWGRGSEEWDSWGSSIEVTRDGGEILHDRWRFDLGDPQWDGPPELRPWPGIRTPAREGGRREVDPVGGERAWKTEGQLVLVPAARPADALLIGPGAFNDRPDPAETVAVLRSWEDRYGAVPLRFCDDRLTLGMRRPPSTVEEGRAAAIEMMAFSIDAFDTEDWGGVFEWLVGQREWEFWWD